MSTPSKILSILLFLLALAFVFYGLKTTARINLQNALVVKLQESIEKQGGAINSLDGVLTNARDAVADLRTKNQQLTDELASTKSAKERTEGDLAQAREEITKLNTELTTTKSQVTDLQGKNQTLQAQITDLTAKQEDLQKKLADENAKVEAMVKQLKAVQSVIAANPALWEVMINPPPPGSRPVDPSGIPIPGRVIASTPEGVTALAFEGHVYLNKGDTLYAYRQGDPLGKMSVGDIYRTIVICQRKNEKVKDALAGGDTVRSKQQEIAGK